MSQGDFEVMPIGTRTELTRLRNFVNALSRTPDADEAQRLLAELMLWYQDHNERHMV